MQGSIADWLTTLDLGDYAEVFARERVSLADLPHLSEQDLKTLGLPLGPRRRVLRAARQLDPGSRPAEASAIDVAVERRPLTVVFSDMVGSTELASRLNPEEYSAVLRAYRHAVAIEIDRHGGFIAQYLGDGVLSYFGWPLALEDAAIRAVTGGLAALANVGRLTFPNVPFIGARVGIASGHVVLGTETDLGAGSLIQTASGAAPNLAARLQALAGAGELVVDETTRRLIADAFVMRQMGPFRLKGFERPVTATRISRPSSILRRFAATRRESRAPLIGRVEERAALNRLWDAAVAGSSVETVSVVGEVGIGKSRLIEAFLADLEEARPTRVVLQCDPMHEASPYHSFARHVETAAGISAHDTPDQAMAKLDWLLRLAGDRDQEADCLIADLLDLGDGTGTRRNDTDRAAATGNALAGVIASWSRERPLVVVIEDAQWMDVESAEALGRLIERRDGQPTLVVASHRQRHQHPFGANRPRAVIWLEPLPLDPAFELARYVAGPEEEEHRLWQIVDRSDGVPLFVEELVRAAADPSALDAESDVPDTLAPILQAQLDRLSAEALKVAQVAAVIGRTLDVDVLAEVLSTTPAALQDSLAELASRRVLVPASFTRSSSGAGELRFGRAMVRDAALASQLSSHRVALRARIEEVLAELGGG